jgi:hypothetical protein
MENKFTTVMAKKTNAELLTILNSERNNYQAIAIEAAEIEISTRDISNEEYGLAQKTKEKNSQIAEYIANEPLETGLKLLILIYPFKGMIGSGVYYNQGYIRKSEEMGRWGWYGVMMYATFILLFML